MPVISRIGTLAVCMYGGDHGRPHFHLRKGGWECAYRIDPPGVLAGRLPPGLELRVRAWAMAHRDELLENWARLQAGGEPRAIAAEE